MIAGDCTKAIGQIGQKSHAFVVDWTEGFYGNRNKISALIPAYLIGFSKAARSGAAAMVKEVRGRYETASVGESVIPSDASSGFPWD